MLTYLIETDYLRLESNLYLYTTGKGKRTTIFLFKKFLNFIKRYYPDELSSFIKILNLKKGDSRALIRDSYFYIQREPAMDEAFKHYLDEIDTIENVETFEVDEYDNPGKYMFHAHVQEFTDLGWMGLFDVRNNNATSVNAKPGNI